MQVPNQLSLTQKPSNKPTLKPLKPHVSLNHLWGVRHCKILSYTASVYQHTVDKFRNPVNSPVEVGSLFIPLFSGVLSPAQVKKNGLKNTAVILNFLPSISWMVLFFFRTSSLRSFFQKQVGIHSWIHFFQLDPREDHPVRLARDVFHLWMWMRQMKIIYDEGLDDTWFLYTCWSKYSLIHHDMSYVWLTLINIYQHGVGQ